MRKLAEEIVALIQRSNGDRYIPFRDQVSAVTHLLETRAGHRVSDVHLRTTIVHCEATHVATPVALNLAQRLLHTQCAGCRARVELVIIVPEHVEET